MRNQASIGTAVLASLVLACGAALPIATTPAAEAVTQTCTGSHWVGSWEAAPSDALNPLQPVLLDQTVREIVSPHLGGSTLRIRLTNRFGIGPMRITNVYVGRQALGPDVQAGSNTKVTFAGRASTTIPAHSDLISDPVRLRFSSFQNLSVSIAVPGLVTPTEHFGARQTSYLTPPLSGNNAASTVGNAYSLTTASWPLLTGIDVVAPTSVGSVVAFGDSITDGWIVGALPMIDDPATRSRNGRYPDFLAHRLAAVPGGTRLSVLNAGISGNQVQAGATAPFPYGPSAIHRVTQDVINQPGVADVILMEGTNDLDPLVGLTQGVSASAVINGLRTIVEVLHRHHIRVLLGTIPPRADDGGSTLARRLVINTWIRTSHVADGVIDFARTLADPTQPNRLRPVYDSGDHLHPSVAGYRAMANAVNLAQLHAPTC